MASNEYKSDWGSVSFGGGAGGSAYYSPYVSSWFSTSLGDAKPLTLEVTYDNGYQKGSDMPDIGGTVCHLCGKPMKNKNTYQRYNKKDNWVTRTYLTYACGTEIFTNEKGVKQTTLGSKCIKPPVNG